MNHAASSIWHWKPPTVLPGGDVQKNELKRLRNLAIVDLMLYSGFRVSEISDFKLGDVKVSTNLEITIREGKHGKYATVLLVDKHSKNLRKWLKYRQGLVSETYSSSPYLFVSERAVKLTSRGIQIMVNKYAKLANMEQVNCHKFRHSYCKNLANAGVNIQTIAELARHVPYVPTKKALRILKIPEPTKLNI